MNKYIMAILGCAFILMGCNSDYNTNAGEKDVNDHTEKKHDDTASSSSKESDSSEGDNLSGDKTSEKPDRIKANAKDIPNGLDVNLPDEVHVEEVDDEMTLYVPASLLFEFDKNKLKPESKQILDQVAIILEEHEDVEVDFNSYTDNTGDKEYNMNLSEERADSVKNYMDEQGALHQVTVTTNGYGGTEPIASNVDEDGQQKNRRLEIVLKGFEE